MKTAGIMKEKLLGYFPDLKEMGISPQQVYKYIYAKVGDVLLSYSRIGYL